MFFWVSTASTGRLQLFTLAETNTELFIIVVMVYQRMKGRSAAECFISIALAFFQNVPPLPVSMVGSYEMSNMKLVVMNQTANGHQEAI